MGSEPSRGRPTSRRPRTVLEQQIREVRRESLHEFVRYAERFAREHGEVGTLSLRHLERLVSGRGPGGKPISRPLPSTCRLLERIFGIPIDELLSPVTAPDQAETGETELRQMIRASGRVDGAVVRVLHEQLNAIRALDRQLGAVIAHEEVAVKVRQVGTLLRHSLMPNARVRLGELLSELCTLAGWQALDMGRTAQAWQYYERSKDAARESCDPTFEAHAAAEQSFVLLEIGDTSSAVELLAGTRARADHHAPRLLRAWLAAAHGEALAADSQRTASLRAFDDAAALLPNQPGKPDGPYVVLDSVHLDRWRGHALARIGEPEAIGLLTSALSRLDSTFARAEAGLRIDLAAALINLSERDEAQRQIDRARDIAAAIGSRRHERRLERISAGDR
ncbi:hypothetical protein ACFS2C_09425 [Prauserella oleivorans]|uniref:XRE family transcriptional regulator n=1 Tax=Prauserella oleivorans TaxID=1478153 RepID=A0ABW5WAI6_9PSEU